ncbi:MAG: 3-phosphoserine/phosphohydroxythreonine transaminase [Buchnera aphidicola (Nurudea ibofushi)]
MDKNKDIVYNFSAGPSMLPKEVLKKVQMELCNWKNSGKSIIEVSHRSQDFELVLEELEYNFRFLLNIPKNYKIIFCHGGARGQFSAIPLNLLGNYTNADYINSGHWSYAAAVESRKYCTPNIINIKNKCNKKILIFSMNDWKINSKSAYLHYCPNETIEGIAIHEEPNFENTVIVGDFSSTLLSRVIDVRKYGVIYASFQKNIGPSGTTVIIIREDLLHRSKSICPSILNYSKLLQSNSMFNTPTTFSIYVSNLVLKWIKKKGGLKEIEKKNQEKANLIYEMIDNTDFYVNNIIENNRSFMNVTFSISNHSLNHLFLKESYSFGLHCLKGHSIVGGFRASIYNSMPKKGIIKLIKFMKIFKKKYKKFNKT